VPYPGCEFFRDFKGKGYSADGLYFDWKQVRQPLQVIYIYVHLIDLFPYKIEPYTHSHKSKMYLKK
jgi:myotubularin-related protein 14